MPSTSSLSIHSLFLPARWPAQGVKFLVVGDRKAFLALYAVISGVGLRAYQLDRSAGLHGPDLQAERVTQAGPITRYPQKRPAKLQNRAHPVGSILGALPRAHPQSGRVTGVEV